MDTWSGCGCLSDAGFTPNVQPPSPLTFRQTSPLYDLRATAVWRLQAPWAFGLSVRLMWKGRDIGVTAGDIYCRVPTLFPPAHNNGSPYVSTQPFRHFCAFSCAFSCAFFALLRSSRRAQQSTVTPTASARFLCEYALLYG
ncbi:hypothetical protein FRC08_012221, partial [Ceratobasidium sp. 394]